MRQHFLVLTVLLTAYPALAQEKGPERYEKSIKAFEAKIESGESAKEGILFIGSSSIRKWDLKKWFPALGAVNHGFGGSEVSDSLHFFDRIVVPLKPKHVVMYAGDNDISRGKDADRVHKDFMTFAGRLKKTFPEAKLSFVAIKPSIARWNLAPEMEKANDKIAKECGKDAKLTYIDIWKPMLGDDGRPMKKLFIKDGLHLSDEGYEIWTKQVQAVLAAD